MAAQTLLTIATRGPGLYEFTREATAVNDFLMPDRVVFGVADPAAAAMVDAANTFADTARALGVLKADALRYLDAAFE